jgi:drug/metabolite transporter, DME family
MDECGGDAHGRRAIVTPCQLSDRLARGRVRHAGTFESRQGLPRQHGRALPGGGAGHRTARHRRAVAAYLAIVPMFLGYVLFGHALATVTASTATTVSLLEPAVAVLLAVIVLREHLPPIGWLGLGLLSASLIITATSTRPTATTHPGSRPAGAPGSCRARDGQCRRRARMRHSHH